MTPAQTVTQNYTYQYSEIAHWCNWLKWKSVGWLYGPCTHSHTELYLSIIAHWCNWLKWKSVRWLYDPCTHSHSELYLSKVWNSSLLYSNWLKWNPCDGCMAHAHTVTHNYYTYWKSEIAHSCKWLKRNLWDGCMALVHTVTQNYSYQSLK